MALEFGPLRQIGSVTRDIDASIAFYSGQAGIGPWFIARHTTIDCTYLGRPSSPVLTLAFANSGLIQLELIQQECGTPSIYREWLDRTNANEGMHHVSMWPTDYDARVNAALAAGFGLEVDGGNERGGFCYLRHPARRDVLIELTELTQARAEVWSTIANAAERWDGSEPLREGIPFGGGARGWA